MTDSNFIARLSSADTEEFAKILLQLSASQEALLRAYLGPERFRGLRSLALRREAIRRELGDKPLGNVIIVPGLLSNELSVEQNGSLERVWLDARALIGGKLSRLRLAENGLTEADPIHPIRVTGLMKREYGELILTLAQQRQVRLFTYDWRKSLDLAATQLRVLIDESFAHDTPFDIVAVAEGGIVARLYMARHRNHWRNRGRLITLGTPHNGAPIFVRALAGHLDITHWASVLDKTQNWGDLISLVRSFPSLYQLLPFATAATRHKALYDANTYGGDSGVRQSFLNAALEIQQTLTSAIDPLRMISVVGYNRPTTVAVDVAKLKSSLRNTRSPSETTIDQEVVYQMGDGDGNIGRINAEFRPIKGRSVPTLYVDTSHHDLLNSPLVLRSLAEMLTVPLADEQTWSQLAARGNQKVGLRLAEDAKPEAVFEQWGQQERKDGEDERWTPLVLRLSQAARRLQQSRSPVTNLDTADEERLIENMMLRHLGAGTLNGSVVQPSIVLFKPPTIKIDLVFGDISSLDQLSFANKPVDAIGVGQYIGTTPQGAVQALDKAISPFFGRSSEDETSSANRLMLDELCLSGALQGDLATLFLLPDPRPAGKAQQRVIAITGMGLPGRFGAPELSLAARELCWLVGRLGKKHLATVLIGAGQNNINPAEAVSAWVRGIKNAITGVAGQGELVLEQITFVEHNPDKFRAAHEALIQLAREMSKRNRMLIEYTPLNDEQLDEMLKNGPSEPRPVTRQTDEPPPMRITVGFENGVYRFGAITSTASMPERDVPMDSSLVATINDQLAAQDELSEQKRRGELMANFLLPKEFRADLSGGAPVVLTVDATTARIHWEKLSFPEEQLWTGRRTSAERGNSSKSDEADLDYFFGIACGLTRQLRSPFARRPEQLPPMQRLLRVLVVADPAADARLPGAEEEGDAIADLLEAFNLLTHTNNQIEVVRLIGPTEATRHAVLEHLITRSYDVLHFAGHCVYNRERPAESGWLFTDNKLLTAREIQRVDRVPSLVVSNACESGVTPDRSDERSSGLAPTFAETFFARGVANFVCTAWPVGDREARDFALTFYASLLGLKFAPVDPPGWRLDSRHYKAAQPEPMFRAMRNARIAIAESPYDRHSWGAYQHYGNPYARLFQPT